MPTINDKIELNSKRQNLFRFIKALNLAIEQQLINDQEQDAIQIILNRLEKDHYDTKVQLLELKATTKKDRKPSKFQRKQITTVSLKSKKSVITKEIERLNTLLGSGKCEMPRIVQREITNFKKELIHRSSGIRKPKKPLQGGAHGLGRSRKH